MANPIPLLKTNLKDIPLLFRGKVRDVFDLNDKLLIVSTDRISAFDFVLPTPIPEKGKILNQISVFWFRYLQDIAYHHLITADVEKYPRVLKPYRNILNGRSMLVKRTKRIDIECVVRGYLGGSAWKEYKFKRKICGIELPKGLKESEKLPKPIFTPATKEEKGQHDINISEERMTNLVGNELANELKEKSLSLYNKASEYALTKGIIIADTKFEFGQLDDGVILIDELLTPDSSRFWGKENYEVGKPQNSFDKQFVRDYLESIGWNKQPPIPELPEEIVRKTQEKYKQALYKLVGKF